MMPPQPAGFQRQFEHDEARGRDQRMDARGRNERALALAAEAEAAREGTSVVDARAPHTIRPGRYGPAIAGSDGAMRGVAERAPPGSGITGEPMAMGGGPLYDMGSHPGVAPGPPREGAAGGGALYALQEAGGGFHMDVGIGGEGYSGVGIGDNRGDDDGAMQGYGNGHGATGGAMVPSGQDPQALAASIASALQSVLPQLQ